VGQTAEFTWQYLGLGNTTCVVDGRRVANDPDSPGLGCVSPLRQKVADGRKHRLEVTFKDVCGATRRDAITFSVADGWQAELAPDLEAPAAAAAGAAAAADAQLLPPPPPLQLAPRRAEALSSGLHVAAGAAGARAGGAAGALGAAAAAALLLLLLC
jgi:hypothetical protein